MLIMVFPLEYIYSFKDGEVSGLAKLSL